MARWNLRWSAKIVEAYLDYASEPSDAIGEELRLWRVAAEQLASGWNSELGLYEQFADYFNLEPLTVAQVAPVPFAADLLLGPMSVAGSQLIKQSNVMLLFLLVRNEVAMESLTANLDFYGPRTTHDSLYSLGVHSTLLASCGRLDPALESLHEATYKLEEAVASGGDFPAWPRWPVSGRRLCLVSAV